LDFPDFASLLMLWSCVGILGSIAGLMNKFPDEGRVIFIKLGKLMIFFPYLGYLGLKLFKKGLNKFKSTAEPT